MYVIKGKRVFIIITCILLGIFAYVYEEQKILLDYGVEETTSTPVSGKVIVLDAGHGTPDERGSK